MKNEKISNYLIILQNILILVYPYLLSKRGNSSRVSATFFLVLLFLIYMILTKNKIIFNKHIAIGGIGYMLFMTISMFILKNDFSYEKFKMYERTIVYLLFGFSITQIEIDRRIYKYILIFFSFLSFFPIYRGVSEWHENNFSPTIRLFGDNWPTKFPVELGIFLLISMVILLYKYKLWIKIIAVFSIVLGYIVILGTQTRIMIILIPLIFLVAVVINKNRKMFMLSCSVIILVLIISFGTLNSYFQRFNNKNSDGEFSSNIRVLIYKRSFELTKKSNFLGIGYHNFQAYSLRVPPDFSEYVHFEPDNLTYKKEIPLNDDTLIIYAYTTDNSHNNILDILLTQGIFSLIFYVYMFLNIFFELIKRYRNDDFKEYKQYFLLGLIVVIYVWINGLTEVTIYMEKVNQMMFFILGLALNKNIKIREEKREKTILAEKNIHKILHD